MPVIYTDNVDGRKVVKVEQTPWQEHDDRIIYNSTVLGRAVVDLEGGGRSWGLVLVPFTGLGQVAQPVVVIFERSTGRFAAIKLPRDRK